mgnify:CR=1 FL=1
MMIHEKYKKQVYDEKLNRFRDITEQEELERELSFLFRDRTENTCNIKEVKDQIKEFKEKLKNLFENRKALNNKIKSLRKKIERKK